MGLAKNNPQIKLPIKNDKILIPVHLVGFTLRHMWDRPISSFDLMSDKVRKIFRKNRTRLKLMANQPVFFFLSLLATDRIFHPALSRTCIVLRQTLPLLALSPSFCLAEVHAPPGLLWHSLWVLYLFFLHFHCSIFLRNTNRAEVDHTCQKLCQNQSVGTCTRAAQYD